MTQLFLVNIIKEVNHQNFDAVDSRIDISSLLVAEIDESCVEWCVNTWGMWYLSCVLCGLIQRSSVDSFKECDLRRAESLFIDARLDAAVESIFFLLISIVSKVISRVDG